MTDTDRTRTIAAAHPEEHRAQDDASQAHAPEDDAFPTIRPGDVVTVLGNGHAFSARDFRPLRRDARIEIISCTQSAMPGGPVLDIYGYEITPAGAYRRDALGCELLRTMSVRRNGIGEIRPPLAPGDVVLVGPSKWVSTVGCRYADPETGTRMCDIRWGVEAMRPVRELSLELAKPAELPVAPPGPLPTVIGGDLLLLGGAGGVYTANWHAIAGLLLLDVLDVTPVAIRDRGTFLLVRGLMLTLDGAPLKAGPEPRTLVSLYVAAAAIVERCRPLAPKVRVEDAAGQEFVVVRTYLSGDGQERRCVVKDAGGTKHDVREWAVRGRSARTAVSRQL